MTIEPLKYLVSQGYSYNVWCGLTTMWAYCSVCKCNTYQTPYTKQLDYKYVCTDCNCHVKTTSH